MENLQRMHDIHKKSFTRTNRKQKPYILADEVGNVVSDTKDPMTLREKYIETLFNDHREEITSNTQNVTGPSFLKEEAIKSAKDGKAPSPYDLPADVLKVKIEE